MSRKKHAHIAIQVKEVINLFPSLSKQLIRKFFTFFVHLNKFNRELKTFATYHSGKYNFIKDSETERKSNDFSGTWILTDETKLFDENSLMEVLNVFVYFTIKLFSLLLQIIYVPMNVCLNKNIDLRLFLLYK
jgi:hypothetical protein